MEQFIADNLFQIIGFVSMLVGIYVTSSKTQAVFNVRMENQEKQIARLEAKQDKSNQVKERVVKLEAEMATVFRKLDEIKEVQ